MATMTFSGIASGIDTSSLIEATLAQKRQARIAPLQNKVTDLESTNSSLDELKTRLNALKDIAAKFRILNGGGISLNAFSSDESVLTASTGNNAISGTYNINVLQLAKNGSLSLNSSRGAYTSGNSTVYSGINMGASEDDRSIKITTGTGAETVSITVNDTTTLSDIVMQYNASSSLSRATIVNKGTESDPNYTIMFLSKKTGTEEGSISYEVGSALSGAGVFDSNTLSNAQNAVFSVDGVSGSIVRQSNTVSDIIPDLSFKLQNIGSASITVEPDEDKTVDALQEFVDAYNDLVEYINENDAISSETDSNGETSIVYGSLSKCSIDENILSTLRTAFSGCRGNGGNVNILADLGITTNRDGTLEFKSDTLKEAMQKDTDSVAKIMQDLGETLASTNGTISQFTRYNGLLDITLNSNKTSISNMNDRIANYESRLASEEKSLVSRYARLESIMGQLQSQQSYITSILSSVAA